MFDDLEPVKKQTADFPRNLENMSVAELTDYVAELKEEMRRVESEREKKQASLAAADSVFKS